MLACAVAVLAVIACPSRVQGRVFQRIPGSGTTVRKLESVGATQAYQSRVTVNGVGADLTVLSFDVPAAVAAARIRAALGTNFALRPGALAETAITDGDRPAHMLVSEVGESRTMVFLMLLDRSPDPSAAVPWTVSAVPLMPGATAVFSFENASTHMRFGVAKTADTAPAAASFCERHLKSRGWELQGPQQSSLTVYTRKQDICMVMIQEAAGAGDATRIVVLEKRLGGP
jgi:hypothetical protein